MHSPHLPARREVQDVVGSCCLLQGRPTVGRSFVLRPVPDGESAGCVCLQRFCSAGCVLPALPSLPAMPTALLKFALPPSIHCALPLFIHVRQDRHVRASSLFQPTCLQAARLPRRQQQRGSAVAARAPCSVQCTVAGAARLPLGSRLMETAFGQPMRRRRYP